MIHKPCKTSKKPSMVRLAVGLGLASLLGSATAASAGLAQVAPGQSSTMAGSTYELPGGKVAACTPAPIIAKHQPNGSVVDFAGFATGQLNDPPLCDTRAGDFTFACTNATRLDAREAVTFSPADVFRIEDSRGQDVDGEWGNIRFKNAFHAADPADTGETTAVAVPLPPAFYTGLGVLMACGVITLLRRFMGS